MTTLRRQLARRIDQRGDDGVTLVLVLVFLLVFGLTVPAVLDLTGTNLLTLAATRSVSNTTYDVDGAAQRAITEVRNSPYNNDAGQSCFKYRPDATGQTETSALTAPSLNGGSNLLVTCDPEPITGTPTNVRTAFNANNTPGQALLTTSTNSGEYGVYQGNNSVFRIRGKVYSHSSIYIPNNGATLVDPTSSVTAVGTCTTPAQVQGAPTQCSDGTAHASDGVDPGSAGAPNAAQYALPSPPPSAVQTVPACSGSRVYTLSPGLFNDASTLSALTTTSCSSPLLYFQPGTYYFNFKNTGSHVWGINNGYVIGGKPEPGTTWLTTYPSTVPTVPGSCITPLESATPGNGVTFIFGGDSQVSVSNGAKVELCGQYSGSSAPIAILGAPSGGGVHAVTATAPPTDFASNGNGKFTTPNGQNSYTGVQALTTAGDGKVATGAFSGGATSATFTSTLTPSTPIPAGATVTSATVTYVHREVTNGTGNTITNVQATLTDAPGSAVATTPTTTPPFTSVAGNNGGPYRSETWDVTSTLAPDVLANGLTSASFALTVNAPTGSSATEQADAVVLTVAYTTFDYEAEDFGTSCVGNSIPPRLAVASSPTNTGCTLITTSSSGGTAFYVQGTTYAPKAALDITLNNVAQQVFHYGLICRALRFDINPSSTFDQPVISLPDQGPVYAASVSLKVYFQVYECPSGVSCTGPSTPVTTCYPASGDPCGLRTGWVRRLSVSVTYVDPSGVALTPPHRGTLISNWAYQRS